MHQFYKPSRSEYLSDLINHYESLVGTPINEMFGEIILQEQSKCQHELSKLKTTDMEGRIMANAFASPSQLMN